MVRQGGYQISDLLVQLGRAWSCGHKTVEKSRNGQLATKLWPKNWAELKTRIRFWGFRGSSIFAEPFLCHGLVILGQQAIYRILVMSSTCQLERTGRGSYSDACWPKEVTKPSFLKNAKNLDFWLFGSCFQVQTYFAGKRPVIYQTLIEYLHLEPLSASQARWHYFFHQSWKTYTTRNANSRWS